MLKHPAIRHTVAFSLMHPEGSPEERSFLTAALALRDIPGVERFEQLMQSSPKSEFAFGFSMEFADGAAYDAYNAHPVHTAFVADRWVPEVTGFQELDYIALPEG